MQQKGEQIQCKQGGREGFLTMTKVVANVVTMILEDIVVFILAFLASATTGNYLWGVCLI